MSSRGPSDVNKWQNDPTSHLIYYLSEHFADEFMVFIASSIQRDQFLNSGPN